MMKVEMESRHIQMRAPSPPLAIVSAGASALAETF
jgi:hypothetical protein